MLTVLWVASNFRAMGRWPLLAMILMGRRPLMSVAFRRFTIDAAVVFGNKENELVVEGGMITLQTVCAKAG